MDSISDPTSLIVEQAAALSRARIDNELSVTAVKRALDQHKRQAFDLLDAVDANVYDGTGAHRNRGSVGAHLNLAL